MNRPRRMLIAACILNIANLFAGEPGAKLPLCISGRYPHLAMFNHNGECGTGALARWADRLWVITYGPHMEHGSDDKLYEIDEQLNRITRSESVGGTPADRMIHKESNQLIIGPYFIDASVIVTEKEKNLTHRFRLPKSDAAYDQPEAIPVRQICEVVTERALLNAHGTFYMLPRLTAGGAEAMKPICTHRKRILDFCSWRGLLCISGTKADAKPGAHYFASQDYSAGLWFGDIDDLWKMGKPAGVGGPWKNTTIKAGAPSDPYLMTGYDKKTIALSHDAEKEVGFTIEVNFDLAGWHTYQRIKVPREKRLNTNFPQATARIGCEWSSMRIARQPRNVSTNEMILRNKSHENSGI